MFVVERDEKKAFEGLLLTLIKDWYLFISFVFEREVILKVDADANLIKFTVQNLFFRFNCFSYFSATDLLNIFHHLLNLMSTQISIILCTLH